MPGASCRCRLREVMEVAEAATAFSFCRRQSRDCAEALSLDSG